MFENCERFSKHSFSSILKHKGVCGWVAETVEFSTREILIARNRTEKVGQVRESAVVLEKE